MEAPLYADDDAYEELELEKTAPVDALRPIEDEEEDSIEATELPDVPELAPTPQKGATDVLLEGEAAGELEEPAEGAVEEESTLQRRDKKTGNSDSDDDIIITTMIRQPGARGPRSAPKRFLRGANLNKWVRDGVDGGPGEDGGNGDDAVSNSHDFSAGFDDGAGGGNASYGGGVGGRPVRSVALAALTPAAPAQAPPQWETEEYPPMHELQKPLGKSAFDVRLNELDDHPWMKGGADLSDYFNYGLTQRTWLNYAERQLQLRYDKDRRGILDREARAKERERQLEQSAARERERQQLRQQYEQQQQQQQHHQMMLPQQQQQHHHQQQYRAGVGRAGSAARPPAAAPPAAALPAPATSAAAPPSRA
ncbi:unnamed protein product, partial [Phaeothamnion confervicola]